MNRIIIIILLTICILFTCCISDENNDNKKDDEDVLYLVNDTYWHYEFLYTRGNWHNFTINDLEFRVVNNNDIILYKIDISEAHPSVIIQGDSKLYPIPQNSTGVWDKENGNIITRDSDINDYMNCYLTYIDWEANNKISQGDTIIIYKDWNNDGEPDIKSDYVFNVYLKNELIVSKKLSLKDIEIC